MSTPPARLLAISILGAVTTLALSGCSKQATIVAGSAVANPTIAPATITPSANTPISSSENTFNFPQASCGDPPTGANDAWYPVFRDGANLEQVQDRYCQDAVLTTREKTGHRTIQLGSFTSRDRAAAFAKAVNGEVGEPQQPANDLVEPAPIKADSSDPRTVVDQFYNAYVFQDKTWRELQDYLDPDTYQQLSQVQQFDANPITDAQVPAWEYAVGDPNITGDIAEVSIRLKVDLRKPPPTFNRNMTVVLQNNDGRWQIKNIVYSPNPLPSGEPNDLLHIWEPKNY